MKVLLGKKKKKAPGEKFIGMDLEACMAGDITSARKAVASHEGKGVGEGIGLEVSHSLSRRANACNVNFVIFLRSQFEPGQLIKWTRFFKSLDSSLTFCSLSGIYIAFVFVKIDPEAEKRKQEEAERREKERAEREAQRKEKEREMEEIAKAEQEKAEEIAEEKEKEEEEAKLEPAQVAEEAKMEQGTEEEKEPAEMETEPMEKAEEESAKSRKRKHQETEAEPEGQDEGEPGEKKQEIADETSG